MLTATRNQIIRAQWQDAHEVGKTRTEFAAWLGITPKALDSVLFRAKAEKEYSKLVKDYSLGEPLTIEGNAVILGDVHAPFHNIGVIDLACKLARKRMPKGQRTLIIAGDLLNLDHFSRYDTAVALPSWQEERDATRVLLGILGRTFDTIYWTMGNHERRMAKSTGMWAEDLVKLCSPVDLPITYSQFGWCNLVSAGVPYRVTHPKGYSRIRGRYADTLENKYRTNIISFHEHHLGIFKSSFGNHLIVNGGCVVDQDKLPYATLDDGNEPDMSLGFCAVFDGHPYVYDEGILTDWTSILGAKYV